MTEICYIDENRGISQPRPQANSRYESERRRLGTEANSLGKLSHRNSPGKTGGEVGNQCFSIIRFLPTEISA